LELNFKEALAALARAFSAYLFYAAALVLGGLLILLEFGLALFVLRLTRIPAPSAASIATAVILLGGWLTLLAWRRLFLFRRLAAMLYLFSGSDPCRAKAAVGQWFPSYSAWARWNRGLSRALASLGRKDGPVQSLCKPAILALAFARGGQVEMALREGLTLYCRHGERTRPLARRWLRFSVMGLALLFLCLALPNWFFFHAAGAPIAIGVALAAVIAWFLHQAFIAPLALSGVSTALLAETRGHAPDPERCEKLTAFFPAAALASKK
jgi:hypothetical protein